MLKINNDFFKKLIDSFIGKGAYILFSLLFSFLATRLYGIEAFGEYTFAFTIVSILMILAKAGLDNGLMYIIPKTKDKFISLSLVTNLIVSIIIILISLFFINDDFMRFMLPLIWLLSLEQIFFGIYRAEGKIREFYLINGILSMILRILMLVLFYLIFGGSVFYIGTAVYLSILISTIFYFYFNKEKVKKIEFDKSFLLYSFPLVLANLLGVIMGKIDILMLGILSTNENVGIYQIVVQITGVVSIILIIFTTVFAPKISEMYHSNDFKGINRIYTKATRILTVSGLITSVILISFSNFFLVIFGEEVLKGETALIYLTLGQLINISVGSVWTMMAMTGKPKLQLYANILAFIINITLNYFLIPIYGMAGAAFATMTSHFITNTLGYIAVSKRFKIKAFKYF